MDVIVGTAGHIDHGKTSLVKALTGVDADRLPEERSRGITIDLGFAEMTEGDIHFGFVDVPGHERFVKNMLAGASGIDVVLLVVAADEGVMPQTREHFDICRLLGLSTGAIAITKTDRVDEETLELAKLEIGELVTGTFLEGARVIPVSAKTGYGLDDLRNCLAQAAQGLPARPRHGLLTRLPIDRSFSMKGFGTVVTGTLAAGNITPDSQLSLLPEGRDARVRGIQSHGRPSPDASAGQRVAVNLGGVDHYQVSRGMTLASRELLPTQSIDAVIGVLPTASKPLRSRQRVRVHLGTSELLARVRVIGDDAAISPGETGFAQLGLELPAVSTIGEKFIIRSYSPQHTIGGGTVLDPIPSRHRRKDFGKTRAQLFLLKKSLGDPAKVVGEVIARSGVKGISVGMLQAKTGYTAERLSGLADDAGAIQLGHSYLSIGAFSMLMNDVLDWLAEFHKHHPMAKGASREELYRSVFNGGDPDVAKEIVGSLVAESFVVLESDHVRLATHQTTFSEDEAKFRREVLDLYKAAKLEVPRLADALQDIATVLPVPTVNKLIHSLLEDGDLIKVSDEFYFHESAMAGLIQSLRASGHETIDVTKFKEFTGVSRKYAIPLLEYLDWIKVTARVRDTRVILR